MSAVLGLQVVVAILDPAFGAFADNVPDVNRLELFAAVVLPVVKGANWVT